MFEMCAAVFGFQCSFQLSPSAVPHIVIFVYTLALSPSGWFQAAHHSLGGCWGECSLLGQSGTRAHPSYTQGMAGASTLEPALWVTALLTHSVHRALSLSDCW